MLAVLFIAAFLLTLSLTWLIRLAMERLDIVDTPITRRKIHKKKIALNGGLAIFLSFSIIIWLLYFFNIGNIKDISLTHLAAITMGGLVLMIGGVIDDKYCLKARYQIWFPVAAALIIIAAGIGPHIIGNPFGGVFELSQFSLALPVIGELLYISSIIVFFWLFTMMYATKVLDGLDGLVTGIVFIGAVMIFFLTRLPAWYQPEISILSIVFAGACLGFLIWNFHPAKIFLGEGGSLYTGFMLGTLAIVSGSKIATTLLVMGIPVLDMIRVIILRIQKKKSIFKADDEHLHFQLLKIGFSHRKAVVVLYFIAFLFGITALFLHGFQKLIALSFLFGIMIVFAVWLTIKQKSKLT